MYPQSESAAVRVNLLFDLFLTDTQKVWKIGTPPSPVSASRSLRKRYSQEIGVGLAQLGLFVVSRAT